MMDRFPVPLIQTNPDDMAELGIKAGDMVDMFNDVGACHASSGRRCAWRATASHCD